MDEITTTADTALALTATLMAGTVAQASGIAMTETAIAGFYTGSVPAGTPAGSYTVLVQSLGNVVASGVLHWDGAAEINPTLAINELHLVHGLQVAAPLTVTTTARTAGSVNQAISGDGYVISTVTRQ